jgi:FkbM family methyltransferase
MPAPQPIAAFFDPPQPEPPPLAPPPTATATAAGPVAGVPGPVRPPPAPDVLLRKAEAEAAMLASPADKALRAGYFDLLMRMASTYTGLQWAILPDLPTPLYFRLGTPDIAVLAQSFRDDIYAFEMAATPQRILVIGAYAGYLPIDLARRFPRASLLCAEPLAENFRLLSVNTTPWRRIRVAQAAIWHSTTRLAPLGRVQADWAVRMTDEALDADRTVSALSVRELLGRAGWHHAEMVVCDACGAEREIFADPFAPWLRHLDAALVRLYDGSAPGATAAVEACFDPALYDRRKLADMELFTRRTPLMALPPAPPEVHVVRCEAGMQQFQLRDVFAAGWAFFVFDGVSCQLHPNPPGQAAATALFPVRLAGHTRLVSGVHHAGGPGAHPVHFTAIVQREDGTVLARNDIRLAPRETGKLTLALPGGDGPARVLLQTEMATGAPNNNMAWSRWLEPTLS